MSIFGSIVNAIFGTAKAASEAVAGTVSAATAAVTGEELWASDGTSPAILKDTPPALGTPRPRELTVSGSHLFSTAVSPAGGLELWKTDGTAAARHDVATTARPHTQPLRVRVELLVVKGPSAEALWSGVDPGVRLGEGVGGRVEVAGHPVDAGADHVVAAAHAAGVALRRGDADTVGIACSELTTGAHLGSVWAAFGVAADAAAVDAATPDALPERLLRTSDYLTHPVFHEHRSEHEMLRYLEKLASRDLSLTEVYRAEEVFCTGTMGELVPVAEVDGRPIGGGADAQRPVLGRLRSLLRAPPSREGERLVSRKGAACRAGSAA